MGKQVKNRRKSFMLTRRRQENRVYSGLQILKDIIRCVIHYMYSLKNLNPVHVVREKHRKLYYADENGSIIVQPKLTERILNLFLSDDRRKKLVLKWVNSVLPTHNVDDFSTSWKNGIVLCALLEALHPGICPGFDHLRHHNMVNNCRLGLKLAQQCYNLPLDMISPEEMAIADASIELKLLKYISMIKWSCEKRKSKNILLDISNISKSTKCTVKGSGIVSGVIGRKCRFNVTVSDVIGMFHLGLEIKGPENEYYSEHIISLHQSKEIMVGSYRTHPGANRYALVDNHVMEYMEDGVGNTFVRWKNLKLLNDSFQYSVIPFNCQCVAEGTFLMTYLPISTGIHTISIKWQNRHVDGSPFKVKIYQPRDLTRKNIREGKDKRVILESLSLSSIEERPPNLLNIGTRKDLQNRNKVESEKSGRYSRSSTRIKKQYTVTKRRVIRKVVTKHGEEIVIQDSPSPTLSRQSSFTDTSTEEEAYRKSPLTSQSSKRNAFGDVSDLDETSLCKHKKTKEDHVFVYRSQPNNDIQRDDNVERPFCTQYKEKKRTALTEEVLPKTDLNILSKNWDGKIQSTIDRNKERQVCCHRSRSDATWDKPNNQQSKSSTFYHQVRQKLLEETCKKRSAHNIPNESCNLKIIQSNSMDKSCCYLTKGRLYRSCSCTSSTSSSSSYNENNKKSVCVTRSLPLFGNEDYANVGQIRYTKNEAVDSFEASKVSRLKAIRLQNKIALDCNSSSDGRSSCAPSFYSPSDSSASSLRSPQGIMIPSQIETKQYTHKTGNALSSSDSTPVPNSGGTCGMRKQNWEPSISKQRATTMYWLKHQTTDHFSVDSTDSDPNYLVEQSIFGQHRRFSVEDLFKPHPLSEEKEEMSQTKEKRGSLDSVLHKKTGLHRQYSVMERFGENVGKSHTVGKGTQVTKDTDHTDITNAKEQKFKSIVTVSNIGTRMSSSQIVAPRVKSSKSTQVSANEILRETGILSEISGFRILRRKKYFKILGPNIQNAEKNVHNHICRKRSSSDGAIFDDFHMDEMDAAFEDLKNNPPFVENYDQRQSTVDTIDSGIAEDNGGNNVREIFSRQISQTHQNGHVKVFRKPYRGHIKLDPRLIKSGSITDSTSADESRRRNIRRPNHLLSCEDSQSFSDSEVTRSQVKRKRKQKRALRFASFMLRQRCKHLQTDSSDEKINLFVQERSTYKDENLTETNMKCLLPTHQFDVHVSSFENPVKTMNVSTSSEEMEVGFGISISDRQNLLGNIQNFTRLSCLKAKTEHINSIKPENQNEDCRDENVDLQSIEQSQIITDQVLFSSNLSRQIKEVEYKSKFITSTFKFMGKPENHISLDKLDKQTFVSTYTIQIGGNSDEKMSSNAETIKQVLQNIREYLYLCPDDNYVTHDDVDARSICRADGLGLSEGYVGIRNNFQVWCSSTDNSNVSVTIHGPRPCSVLETDVIYTGDNLFEVIYEVAYPGFYVICVKWGDQPIPGSPFLCNISYS